MTQFQVGDRVEVVADSVGDTQRSKAKINKKGNVEMILDDGLVIVAFGFNASVSYWPDELRLVRRPRKKKN